MKLLKHFSMFGKANSYIIGPDNGGDAILIDPAIMDIHMLNLIENNNYYIKHILITHAHANHTQALRTIKKIYDATIYSYHHKIGKFPSTKLLDNQRITLSGIDVEVKNIPGHSTDSLIYIIDSKVFVGDVLSSGLLGSTSNKYEEELLIDGVESKILTLDDNILVLPGHGPPSIIGTEKKMFNLYTPLK